MRNYQARNFLRDDIAVGDGVLFYHSSADPPAVAGTARVVRAGYPDPTQFDAGDGHHDPDSSTDDPRWYAVDIQLRAEVRAASHPPRAARRQPPSPTWCCCDGAAGLSVQPVTPAEWKAIVKLGARA